MYRVSGIALVICAVGVCAPIRWEPDVVFSGGRLTGLPATEHRAQAQHIEIIEEERCTTAAQRSGASLVVPESCAFLRGFYRYSFTPAGGTAPRQMLMEFSVTRAPGKGYGLIVASPIMIADPAP